MKKQNKSIIIVLLIFIFVSDFKCNTREKSLSCKLTFEEIKKAEKPEDAGLSEDEYVFLTLDPEGKTLLYIVEREVKEGWGIGHGNELVSFDLERKMKLPLGKLGRSNLVKVIRIGNEYKNAVTKTVDTDGNGDIDERDANQLYLTSQFGLDEEPVSPIGQNVVGVWEDPLGQWVVFAVSSQWQGKKRRKNEPAGDPTPVVWLWDYITKQSRKIAICESFYGFSPDGLKLACLPPGKKENEGREVVIYDRGTLKPVKRLFLPVTSTDQVFLLNNNRVIYSRGEETSAGVRSVLWWRESGGKEKRITNPSVDSRIIQVLRDGSVVFQSRAIDSVHDFIVLRVLSGDGQKIKTIFKKEGNETEFVAVSECMKSIAYFNNKGGNLSVPGGNTKKKILISSLVQKVEEETAQNVKDEKIETLADAIIEKISGALSGANTVDIEKISVDIRKNIVFVPVRNQLIHNGETFDDALIRIALQFKSSIVSALKDTHPAVVFYAPQPQDAVSILQWIDKFGEYFTFFSAYGETVPIKEEYNIVVEDLSFRKIPGCADPRLVKLHCSGWLTVVGKISSDKLTAVCKAEPLNPMQQAREEIAVIEIPDEEGTAVEFDIAVDKVDPRRSNRYSYFLDFFEENKPVPYYDASWARASRAWIEFIRGLNRKIPSALIPYSERNSPLLPLAKWRPDTVVNRDAHTDIHLFLKPADTIPPIDDKHKWDVLAQSIMNDVENFNKQFDQGKENDVRVAMYVGNDLVIEKWHKTAGEILEEKIAENPSLEYMLLPGEKGKIKPKTKEEKEIAALMEEALSSKVPQSKLGLPPLMIEKKDIQKVVASHFKEVKFCYEKEASLKNLGSGQITVKMAINKSGSVQSAEPISDTLKDKEVTQCLLKTVTRWKFPIPTGEGNGTVTISYPFTFTSSR